MELHPVFKIRERATKEIIQLLDSVTLGTNDAHYRHLDTTEKIKEADNPLFLSLERNKKVLGNITFCRRDEDWYVRYFAFDTTMQSSGQKKSDTEKPGLLKSELSKFFSVALKGENESYKARSFYAYIDPRNEKSLWMSENFGFKPIAKIATQTFSRANPKATNRLQQTDSWEEVKHLVKDNFANYNYYFDVHTQKPPFYTLRDEKKEIMAFAKISKAHWEIKRLPGKFGGVLTKIIPWVPRLRRIIRPKNHSFIVPEAVIVKGNDPEILSELFEGILAVEDKNLIIWWTDEATPLYSAVRKSTKWGLLDKLIGVAHADLVVMEPEHAKTKQNRNPFYTVGYDFI